MECGRQKSCTLLRERKRYIQEVAGRKKENPRMEVASLRVSVDYCLLENMHVMGRFDSSAPDVNVEKLTEDHIKAFLESITKRTEEDGYNPVVIENALKGVRMPMNIEDPEARVFEFYAQYLLKIGGRGVW